MARIVFLGAAVDDEIANVLTAQMLFLESVDAKLSTPAKPVNKFIRISTATIGYARTKAVGVSLPSQWNRVATPLGVSSLNYFSLLGDARRRRNPVLGT